MSFAREAVAYPQRSAHTQSIGIDRNRARRLLGDWRQFARSPVPAVVVRARFSTIETIGASNSKRSPSHRRTNEIRGSAPQRPIDNSPTGPASHFPPQSSRRLQIFSLTVPQHPVGSPIRHRHPVARTRAPPLRVRCRTIGRRCRSPRRTHRTLPSRSRDSTR